jgi:hypothetical protein
MAGALHSLFSAGTVSAIILYCLGKDTSRTAAAPVRNVSERPSKRGLIANQPTGSALAKSGSHAANVITIVDFRCYVARTATLVYRTLSA